MTATTVNQSLAMALQHHQAGRLPEAEKIYRQVLAQQPRNANALHMLGMIARQVGRLESAIDLIHRALAIKPNFPEAYFNLGNIYVVQGKMTEAISAYTRAAQLKGDAPEVHNNLGNALSSIGKNDEAMAEYATALRIRPDHLEPHWGMGRLLAMQGRHEEAIECYRNAVRVRPDSPEAHVSLARMLLSTHTDQACEEYRQALQLRPDPGWQFELAAHSGDNSVRTVPPGYVRGLFDAFSPAFERQMVERLQYRVPQELLAAVLAAAPKRLFDALDLGCGTGLCGVQIKPYSRSLAGVDLSPRMIQAARDRQIYDELFLADLFAPLRVHPSRYDLILAGDVLIYVGDLSELMPAVTRSLRPGGVFAFSIENHEGNGYFLTPHERFAHSLDYIRQLAAACDLKEISTGPLVLRKQGNVDVQGWIVVLGKAAKAAA